MFLDYTCTDSIYYHQGYFFVFYCYLYNLLRLQNFNRNINLVENEKTISDGGWRVIWNTVLSFVILFKTKVCRYVIKEKGYIIK